MKLPNIICNIQLCLQFIRKGPTFQLLGRGYQLCFPPSQHVVFFSITKKSIWFFGWHEKLVIFFQISYRKVLKSGLYYIFVLIPFPDTYKLNGCYFKYKCLYCMYIYAILYFSLAKSDVHMLIKGYKLKLVRKLDCFFMRTPFLPLFHNLLK